MLLMLMGPASETSAVTQLASPALTRLDGTSAFPKINIPFHHVEVIFHQKYFMP